MHSRLTGNLPLPHPPKPGIFNKDRLCFRTRSDGTIPVKVSWVDMFNSVNQLENYYLQTRHMGCRLIQKTSPITLFWVKENQFARDTRGQLFFEESRGLKTTALIQRCECCGSPGRLSVFNPYNLEIMQICASTSEAPENWARAIADCIALSRESFPSSNPPHLPIIPAEAETLYDSTGAGIRFLVDFFQTEVSFTATLSTTGIRHRMPMNPTSTRWAIDLIEVFGPETTIQLCPSVISELYVIEKENRLSLVVGSIDQFQLLSIDPPENERASELYQSVLKKMLKDRCNWQPNDAI